MAATFVGAPFYHIGALPYFSNNTRQPLLPVRPEGGLITPEGGTHIKIHKSGLTHFWDNKNIKRQGGCGRRQASTMQVANTRYIIIILIIIGNE